MTKSEYQELVVFLGKRFAKIDGRFDGIEARLARTEVTVEENRHLIQVLAEGLTGFREEMARGFVAVREEMREGFRTVPPSRN